MEEKVNGIPVPKEGTPEYEKMNKMAKRAIPLILIIFTLGILEQQAFGMIFVNIGKQLGVPGQASLITSIPGIVLGVISVIYGSLGDFVSLKKMTFLGIILFVLGSVIGFVLGPVNIWAVVVARVLQSAGGQVAGSVFLVLVSKYVSKASRVLYYQIFVAVFRFSAALGVVLAGLIETIDWRWLFAAPIVTLLFIPALNRNLPDLHAKGAKIDVIGFSLIDAFAASVTMYFTNYATLWAVLSVITLILFSVYIHKAKDPFITPQFFKNPAFIAVMAVIFVGYFFSYTINAGINAIGLNVYHVSSSEISSMLVWSILLAAVLGFAGPILKKLGRTLSIVIALSFMGLGLISVAFFIPMGPVWTLAVAPCIYYFGTSFFYSPIVDSATLTVPAEESGRVLGINDLVQAITGSIGVAVFSGMMSSGVMSGGSVAGVGKGTASTYANVFIIGGVVILAALVIYLVFHKVIYSRASNVEKKL
ncbi:MFS transporter [Pediococcus acidilactici]|uniref:MFS transporter n=1 Tax=Pediococcus acidilactici TaxID=1254 RepID=UPI00232B4BA4|nr:MFS transporter [Pediococcus acidilactici]MDB8876895.1 MFS transporter [Pediococcus acidilactici]